jgi:integrase
MQDGSLRRFSGGWRPSARHTALPVTNSRLHYGTLAYPRSWQAINGAKGTAQSIKAAVLIEQLRRMRDCLPDTLRGVRDRALLLLGFAAALRRSELVALNAEDVLEVPEGLVVMLR